MEKKKRTRGGKSVNHQLSLPQLTHEESQKSEKLKPDDAKKKQTTTSLQKRQRGDLVKSNRTRVRHKNKKVEPQKTAFQHQIQQVKQLIGYTHPPSNRELRKMGYPKEKRYYIEFQGTEQDGFTPLFSLSKWISRFGIKEDGWIANSSWFVLLDRTLYKKEFFLKYAEKQYRNTYNYNHYDMEIQYQYDTKIKRKKFWVSVSLSLVLIIGVLFVLLPKIYFQLGVNAIEKNDYRKAYGYFIKSNTSESIEYAKYAKAFGVAQEGRFKEGEIILDDINAEVIQNTNSDTLKNEYIYAEGKYWLSQEDQINAARAFKKILQYKDARQLFNEAAYLSAELLLKEGKTAEAILNLESVGDYKDAIQKKSTYIEEIYTEGKELYALGLYGDAGKLFSSIAPYRYKDASTMVIQSIYYEGLVYYQRNELESVITTFEPIKRFKDVSTILKDVHYQLAQEAIKNQDSWGTYVHLTQSFGYKDSGNLMLSPEVVLFGNWKIITSNGAAIDPIELKFSEHQKFRSDFQIAGILLNTEYQYNGTQFVTESGGNNFTLSIIDSNHILLHTSESNVEYQYELTRVTQAQKIYDPNTRKIEEILNDYFKTNRPELFEISQE